MKKRLIALLLAAVMTVSLLPISVWADDAETAVPEITAAEASLQEEVQAEPEAEVQAAAESSEAAVFAAATLDSYFDGLPVIAETEPGSPNSTNKWKVTTLDGESVLMSGNKDKNSSTSTLQLTFTSDTQLTFEYKVSSETKYDTCTISLGSTTLVNGESGDQDWKTLEVDAKNKDVLKVVYKKDSSTGKYDDCVYLRNFSAGEALVVTLHANNGTDDTVQQKIYGGKGSLKANTFTCDGKIFAGWAASAGGEVLYQDGAAITVTANLDLYAVWADAYTVTFDNDGSTTEVLVPQNSAIGSRIPADPSKKGYTFGGWFSGETQLTAETVISGDVTYKAKWTPITYTIAFDANEGTGTMESITATYDQKVTLPECIYTRAGYNFNGWATYKSASYGTYSAGQVVSGLTSTDKATYQFYATWKGKSVTVTVDLNDGSTPTTYYGTVGSNYNYLKVSEDTYSQTIKDPTRTGYIFDGWFDAAEGGNKISTSYKFTAADAENGFVMYAHWTEAVTITFDANGGTCWTKTKDIQKGTAYGTLPSATLSGKAFDGWYTQKEGGTKVENTTVFNGNTTLYARWRDYQYIIKFNIKYSDKSSVTGTMADQAAPFGQDVKLNKCAFTRDGYEFAGWSTSSYGSTVTYADEATINREWDDDYWSGSEDGETYDLYAVWTEKKSPEQIAAEAKLDAAEKAISGTYNPVYGTDTNALTMIRAKLTAAGITDVTVSMKEAYYSSYNHVGVTADGDIQYKWNENGTTSAASGTARPTLVLTYNTYTRESTDCLFNIPLDEAKAMAALRAVAGRITLPAEVESADDLTSLPRYPLKAGVDESKVDYNSSTDLELWTTAVWTSSNTGVISISEVSYPYFSPYKATVTLPKQDTSVTLTLTLTYNGREDLKVSKAYTVTVKRDTTPRELDYQALLEAALTEYGLHDPRDNASIDTANVVSDIQFPTTKQLNTIAYRDYNQDFDGKYTPILLCTSDDSVIVSADPATANVARMLTYRPLPGQTAKTVTVTVKILSRPSGEGKDYASMPVLASKDITLTVQPLTQTELDTAAAFMKKVCTEDVYWEGIRKANTDKTKVTGDMRSFIEIVPDGDGYKFIRDMDSYNAVGVKADDIPGWYDAQKYRCFRSSQPSIIAHETLLLTQPKYNTRVTIDSVLTYTEYAKYYEKFQGDPDYAQFAKFYKQPISTTVTVIGTEGIEDPDLQPVTVTVKVEGSSFDPKFINLTNGSYTCTTGDHRTAADALIDVLTKNGYTYSGTPGYITGITDPKGNALSSGDKTYGPASGWMFTVNGKMPILGTDKDGNTLYATLDKYQLQKDDVIRLYYVACPSESGHHTGGTATCTKQAECSVCGAYYGDVDRNNHIGDTEVRNAKDATCTKAGYTGDTYCKSCDTKVTGGKEIPAIGHKWDNGVVAIQPTTVSSGLKTFTCTVCHTTKTELIPKLGNPSQPANPGTTPTQPIPSQKTGDAGIALYAAMSLLSLTGGALVLGKKRKDD